MNAWDRKLLRDQLDDKLTSAHPLPSLMAWQGGVLRLFRQALGLTTAQLGRRAKVDQSRITQLEGQEALGNIKLVTMQKMAEAMDMVFVYGFVPKTTLQGNVLVQAQKYARHHLTGLAHTMQLEQQGLQGKDVNKAFDDLVQKILFDPPKDFWDIP